MCGRFVQSIDEADWQSLLQSVDAKAAPAPERRFNLAPSQAMTGARREPDASRAEAHAFRFGLRGANDHLVINARAETVHERPMFRGLVRKGRVLVAASAFYEWAPAPSKSEKKTPWCFARADGKPFWFAALARTDGDEIGAVLMTTSANDTVADIHARMPVMLESDQARAWLDVNTSAEQALQVLVPYSQAMRAWRVGLSVNNPRYDASSCIEPQGERSSPV